MQPRITLPTRLDFSSPSSSCTEVIFELRRTRCILDVGVAAGL
jgi:hypothetical protein